MLKKYGLFVVPLLFLLFVRFGLNFNGLYGQDAYEYLRYAGRLKDFFVNGNSPGDYFWPIGYPFYGALLSFLTQDVAFALQLLSTLTFVGTIWYAKKILTLLFPEKDGKYFYLIAFLLLSPFLLRSSLLCMSDAGAVFFVIGFFYHAFRFRKDGRGVDLLMLFLFAANAFMFRYVSLVLLVIPSIYLLREIAQKKYIVSLLFGMLLFFIFLLPHIFIRASHPVSFLNHEWLTEWSFANYFRSSFATADGLSHALLPNIVFSLLALFHPGNFIFGIVALFFLFRQRPIKTEEKVLLASVLLYVLFLAGMPIQNLRFFLLPLPLLIISSFRGFSFVYEKMKSKTFILFSLVILFQGILFVYGFRLIYARNRLEHSIKEWIAQHTKQPVIYSFDMDVSLKSGGLDRTFYNMWEKEYNSFEPNSLLLFNAPAFEKQWEGKNPMKNWEKVNRENHLVLLKSFPEGWNLYEIR